jgi:hypothetical protein
MIVQCLPYNPPRQYLFMEGKRKMKLVKRIRNKIATLGLKPEDANFAIS